MKEKLRVKHAGGTMARASAALTESGVGTRSVHVRENKNNDDNDNNQLASFFVTPQAKEGNATTVVINNMGDCVFFHMPVQRVNRQKSRLILVPLNSEEATLIAKST